MKADSRGCVCLTVSINSDPSRIYIFLVGSNPLERDSLKAFFPLERSLGGTGASSCDDVQNRARISSYIKPTTFKFSHLNARHFV